MHQVLSICQMSDHWRDRYIIICIFIGAFIGSFIFNWTELGSG